MQQLVVSSAGEQRRHANASHELRRDGGRRGGRGSGGRTLSVVSGAGVQTASYTVRTFAAHLLNPTP